MGRLKRKANEKIDEYIAPTPKWWKIVRNIAGTISAVAFSLIPFTGGASGIVGIVALVANIIAGTKTLTRDDVEQMTRQELYGSKLLDTTYGKREGKDVDALALVDSELNNKDRV